MNKLNEILIQNSNIFIQENALESVVCETAAILSRLNVLIGSRHISVPKNCHSDHQHLSGLDRNWRYRPHNAHYAIKYFRMYHGIVFRYKPKRSP